jgi:hypothetical protein
MNDEQTHDFLMQLSLLTPAQRIELLDTLRKMLAEHPAT